MKYTCSDLNYGPFRRGVLIPGLRGCLQRCIVAAWVISECFLQGISLFYEAYDRRLCPLEGPHLPMCFFWEQTISSGAQMGVCLFECTLVPWSAWKSTENPQERTHVHGIQVVPLMNIRFNPTTKIGSKMGGECTTYQPKWDPKTVLTLSKGAAAADHAREGGLRAYTLRCFWSKRGGNGNSTYMGVAQKKSISCPLVPSFQISKVRRCLSWPSKPNSEGLRKMRCISLDLDAPDSARIFRRQAVPLDFGSEEEGTFDRATGGRRAKLVVVWGGHGGGGGEGRANSTQKFRGTRHNQHFPCPVVEPSPGCGASLISL